MTTPHDNPTIFQSQEQAMSPTPGVPGSRSTLGPAAGRSSADEHSLRSISRSVKFTPEEWQTIRDLARAGNMTPAGYMRAAALQLDIEVLPPVPAVNANTYVELGRVGGLLNQIAKQLNQRTRVATPDAAAITKALSGLTPVLKSIRAEVLGVQQ